MSAPPPTPRRAARLLALAALLLSAAPAAAQSAPASLRLRVTDAATGEPVRGARAVLLDGASVVTGDDGTARMVGLTPGVRVAEVAHVGYGTARVMARLAPGEASELDVRLSPRPVALEALRVRGRRAPQLGLLRAFHARASTGAGHYITREQIVREQPRELSDLFRGVPGMTMIRVGWVDSPRMDGLASALPGRPAAGAHSMTTVAGGADCPILYFLDGTPFEPPGGDIDAEVDPDEVEGIEVYRRASTAPPQYRRGDGCGIVLIWRREQLERAGTAPPGQG